MSVQADDEGNAYARLGNVLSNLGRTDEARTAYERGITQSEKHGHSGMADDLRLALIQLNEWKPISRGQDLSSLQIALSFSRRCDRAASPQECSAS